ncbi:MAG: sulfatase-like hydrolase/transferase [Planctomycetaceae bacterium]|nr:sulfatase-like hydrolase/transferase [Planctomycetaceae bacterium]
MSHPMRTTTMTFTFFLASLVLLFGMSVVSHAEELPGKHPNILMILVDDLGYADLACYGNQETITPRLDALARSGQKFTMFRTNSPVCSPTRAALMTGMFPDRAGVPGVIRTHANDSWGYFSPHADTLPQLLKTAGYHTALVGKWHLGLESPNLPNERGFDLFHGFLGDMMDDYYTHLRHGNNYMRHNAEVINVEGHATDVFTDWACEFIRDRAPKPEPFFLYLSYNAPHTPIQPAEDWLRRVQTRMPNLPESKAKYYALVEHMDDAIGKVLDVLDEMNIAENTLVVFTSDNGGAPGVGGNNGNLRNGKGSMYEGGLRVPTIVRWTPNIKPGTATAVDAMTADLFPTLLEAARCEVQPRQSLDGVSLMPVFLGREAEMPKRNFYFVRREGGAPFFGQTNQAVISDGWKLVHNAPTGPLELFNLSNDPFEQTNLAGQEREQFTRMFRLLQLHIQQGGRAPWQQPER